MSRKRRRAKKAALAAQEEGALALVDGDGSVVHVAPLPVAESLRYMVARLRLGGGSEIPDRLGLTSAISGEGVTFVARTLALVLANDMGRRVCLVELNWWSPAERNEPSAGLADVLRGTAELEEAVCVTGTPGVSILPAGSANAAERPLFAQSQELDKILVDLSEVYDQLILDLPAVHTTSEALTLAERSRAVALVIGHGVTPESQIKDALDQLHGVDVIGAILNRSSTSIPRAVRRRIPGA